MDMDRRQFVTLTIGALACATLGCATTPAKEAGTPTSGVVDAGLETDFAKDGVYDAFKDRGFFLIRRGSGLVAVSSICTHRNCKLRPQKDQSFLCPCHGSTFDPEGKVMRGPARRDLPRFETRVDERGHVIVAMSQ